jgi:membrane protein involved in colicin uptake
MTSASRIKPRSQLSSWLPQDPFFIFQQLDSMVKNNLPDYRSLFLQEMERRKEAESSQKQAEASQKQAETSQKQAETSQKQAEASQKQAEASQKQAENREKHVSDEERRHRERTRLTNFEEFLQHIHTYPRDL